MSVAKKTQIAPSIFRRVISIIYFEIVVRLFTLPTWLLIVGLYVGVLEIPYDILGVEEPNANIIAQTGNYILGDNKFVDEEVPYLLFLLVTLVGFIETTIYSVLYSKKISFPRFLHAYKTLLIMSVPIWAVFIALISSNAKTLLTIVYLAFAYFLIWAMLNAEYALYVFFDKYFDYHSIREKKVNQRARPPWTVVKDLKN